MWPIIALITSTVQATVLVTLALAAPMLFGTVADRSLAGAVFGDWLWRMTLLLWPVVLLCCAAWLLQRSRQGWAKIAAGLLASLILLCHAGSSWLQHHMHGLRQAGLDDLERKALFDNYHVLSESLVSGQVLVVLSSSIASVLCLRGRQKLQALPTQAQP